jgi:hypothetical protein
MNVSVSRLLNGLYIACFLLFSSCSKKPAVSSDIALFIQFPQNTHVFENMSPILYEAVHQHFARTGFNLAENPLHAYQLGITITSLDTIEKNVSAEIILLSFHVRMTCKITVLNYAAEEIFSTIVTCDTLINKPRNPSHNDDFILYAHSNLAARTARLIQQQILVKLGHIFSPSP